MKKIIVLLAAGVSLALSPSAFSTDSHDHRKSSRIVSNVFVSNSGPDGQTFSLIRCITTEYKHHHRHKHKSRIRCKEKQRSDVGFNTSWPANQYRGKRAWWWTGLSGEVVGVRARTSLEPIKNPKNTVFVDTYNIVGGPDSGSNFIGIMPDGRTAWNSAREVDRIQEIDTNPRSPTFGTILTDIRVPDMDKSSPATETLGAARPCDATITPDGRYFMEPDLAGESLTIVDTKTKQIIHQMLPPLADGSDKVLPFMATTNGKIVLVENLELDNTYDVWDISRLPDEPRYLKKITQADGLGVDAQTSEFTPDGRYAFLVMRGVEDAAPDSPDASRLDVLDVRKRSPAYLQIVDSVELPQNCRATTGDFSNDGRYFFASCTGTDELVIVDNKRLAVVDRIPVGDGPRGVIVR